VLVGLSRAPQFVQQRTSGADLWSDQVDAIVIPATACGGSAVLSFSQTTTQIITVRDNTTRLNVTAKHLGLSVTEVHSYLEALGVLVAHKAGIQADALSPTISPLSAWVTPSPSSL
jgi:hypothetical protein